MGFYEFAISLVSTHVAVAHSDGADMGTESKRAPFDQSVIAEDGRESETQ